MDKLDKTLYITSLLIIYMSQLSKTQQEIMSDYYLYDLSITEIAENRNISRAAVDDALSKGKNKLEELEKDLKIFQVREDVLKGLASLKSRAINMKEVKEIEEIEQEFDIYGI